MRNATTLSLAALLLAGFGLATPAFAHGNDGHQVQHSQQRQAHHARHDAGISRQQDRLMHRQERRNHRVDHQIGNGLNNSWYYQNRNLGNNWSGTTYPVSQYPVTQYGTVPYYGYNGAAINSNSYWNGNAQAAQNGHFYNADGHRFDHHGNHDDGPGDL